MEIVVAEEFGGHLGHAIHGLRALDGVLRGADMRSRRSERADGTRSEHCTSVLSGYLQHIPEAINADFPCELRLGLGDN